MYKCLTCGHLFDYGEEKVTKEYRGECFGFPTYEDVTSCPICGGNFEKTKKCKICGSEHLEEELKGCVCEECINNYRNNFDICYKISIGETTEIKINSLIASIMDELDIEAVLLNYIKKGIDSVDCSPFIDYDINWFGEKLVEEVKKNENGKK